MTISSLENTTTGSSWDGGLADQRMVRRSSGEQVAWHIRRLIFEGRLRRGDRVPQDDIAEQLGVSRVPVREAIIALDREGWVSIEPHRGAFVQGLDEHSVRDHYELLGLIYGLVARRAAERADDERIALLVDDQRVLAVASDPADFYRANDRYLRRLLELADSPRLTSVLRVLSGVVPGNFFELVPGAVEQQRRGIAAITRAVRRGNADRAAEEWQRLLRRHGEHVIELLQVRGVLSAGGAAAHAAEL